MATIYESKGIRFCIYPRDHPPPHCHVIHRDWELKLDLTKDFEVFYIKQKNKDNIKKHLLERGDVISGPSKADILWAQRIARENKFEMGKTWREYHGT